MRRLSLPIISEIPKVYNCVRCAIFFIRLIKTVLIYIIMHLFIVDERLIN